MELKKEIYREIQKNLNLRIKIMEATQQRESTVQGWCRTKSDQLLKYPTLRLIAAYLGKRYVDELIEDASR